jgi:hypothetical protein
MFIDWQNEYLENGCTSESNLQIQSNPHQNLNVILYRNREINPKIKSLQNQSNPEVKE